MQHMNSERSFFSNTSFNTVNMNHTSLNGAVLYDTKMENVITNNMLLVETKMDLGPELFKKSRMVDLKDISKNIKD
jgi:uncharacterized protein YjbI with pentapeptide repeats